MKSILFSVLASLALLSVQADDSMRSKAKASPSPAPVTQSSASAISYEFTPLGGVAFTQDAGLQFSDGTTATAHFNPAPTAGGRIEANVWRFNDALTLAVAPEFLWTPLRFDIRDVPASEVVSTSRTRCRGLRTTVTDIPGWEASGEMDRYDTSLNVLAKYRYSKLTAYAGPGAVFSVVDIHDLAVSGAASPGDGATDWSVGAQATGGIRYAIDSRWSAGLEGKYAWVPNYSFDLGADSVATDLTAVSALVAINYAF